MSTTNATWTDVTDERMTTEIKIGTNAMNVYDYDPTDKLNKTRYASTVLTRSYLSLFMPNRFGFDAAYECT